MRTVADKDSAFIQHVEMLRETTHPDSDHKPLPGLQDNYSPQLTFFDLRSSDSSNRASTPVQPRKIQRSNPDNDDLSSLGSYTRTKLIPKKSGGAENSA